MSSLHDLGIDTSDWTSIARASSDADERAAAVRVCLKSCEYTLGHLTMLVADIDSGSDDPASAVRFAFFADVVDMIANEARKLVAFVEATKVPYGVSNDLAHVKICVKCFDDVLKRDDLAPHLALRQNRPKGIRPAGMDQALYDDIMNLMNRPMKPLGIEASPMRELDRSRLQQKQ
jgi:hypothetical protein